MRNLRHGFAAGLMLVLLAPSFAVAGEKGPVGYRLTVEDYTEGYVVPKVATELLLARNCTPSAIKGVPAAPAQFQELNKLLERGNPGSRFDCERGIVTLVQPSARMIFRNFKEERLEKDYGQFSDVWLPGTDTVARSVGKNSIAIRINREEPEKSIITAATLPVLEETVKGMGKGAPSTLFAKGNLVRILNETYRTVYAPQEHTLLNFAYFVMSDQDVQQEVIRQAQLAKTPPLHEKKRVNKAGQKSAK
ncbi:hypothetical protein [Geobacter sp. AOG1]|uniref:hypothetical protein n=1 Tax=Geobacter sp. AOG1 TaxID=1566346 RepID=UPI001CC7DFA5|nr:hypothetical protein [Geobacter sp. AOG1]GFE57899.1 hypothetical protein AOG1_17790 [Geobacter sp. AOG1]